MDFNLSKEELLVQQMYRDFAENEVKPLAGEVDEEERFPVETVKKMAKLGMMGIYYGSRNNRFTYIFIQIFLYIFYNLTGKICSGIIHGKYNTFHFQFRI